MRRHASSQVRVSPGNDHGRPARLHQRVDDGPRIGVGCEPLGDRPEAVAGLDGDGDDLRTAPGATIQSGDLGGTAERRAGLGEDRHDSEPDRRGDEPPPAVHRSAVAMGANDSTVAARRPGMDCRGTGSSRDGPVEEGGGYERADDCGHGVASWLVSGAETGLLVEPTTRVRQQRWTNACSGVKGNLERVFVTNV